MSAYLAINGHDDNGRPSSANSNRSLRYAPTNQASLPDADAEKLLVNGLLVGARKWALSVKPAGSAVLSTY